EAERAEEAQRAKEAERAEEAQRAKEAERAEIASRRAPPPQKRSSVGIIAALLVVLVVLGVVVYRFGADGSSPPASAPTGGAATAAAFSAAASQPPAPSAAPSAVPDSAARSIELGLEIRAEGPAQRPTVFVVSKALGIEERVTEVPNPFVCRLAPSEGGGSVTCTPDTRKVELAIVKQAGALELSRPGGPAKRAEIPPGVEVVIGRSERSSRDLPGGQCPPGGQSRTLEAPFLNQFDAAAGSKLSILIPNAERTRVQQVQLFRNPSAARCRSEGTDRQRHLRCEGVNTECDVRVDGASVAFECTGAIVAAGRVLLPCGAEGRLPTSGLIAHVPY
ncbi:MAG: hypothetical protein KJ015_23965, partial [Myxococcales bacterium]|nr:hypothetical protein [Myxococcales bacterium]